MRWLSLWNVAAVGAIAAAAGCDSSGSTKHWFAYATETTSRRTVWLFLDPFSSANDCYHAAHQHVVTKQDGGYYNFPIGCAYSGSDRYWTWLVNVTYQVFGYSQPEAFECIIARSVDPSSQDNPGNAYFPILHGAPREGPNYYCL
jgi:hypothetical protein